eukprot:421379_1
MQNQINKAQEKKGKKPAKQNVAGDLDVFKDEKNECDPNNNENPIEACTTVNRLVSSLKYCSLLDLIKNPNHKHAFTAFISDIYPNMLNDYGHLVQKHNNLENINKQLLSMKQFGPCDPFSCAFSTRHNMNNNNNNAQNEGKKEDEADRDGVLQFYKNQFDALHFYLFHLYQCGLRTEKPNENDVETKNDENNNENKLFDKEFSRVTRLIKERQHITDSFDRFESSNKFSIMAQQQQQEQETTFMDEMCSYLSKYGITKNVASQFAKYIRDEEYDTDSIKMTDNYESFCHLELVDVVVKKFIKATTIKSSSFSIGILFYYWPKYKNASEFPENTNQYNLNDHGGYDFADLYVAPKYLTFKEEISNYKHFEMSQYEELVIKIKEYMKQEFVKKMKADNNKDDAYNRSIKLEYDISDWSAIRFYHLTCVLFYTDYSDLCTNFSSTFRGSNAFEPLSSIKKRNANYWWMAKGLREAVQLFGYKKTITKSYYDEEKGWLEGPFYSGLRYVLCFPAFELRLCGPTSTSTQIEVATKFATRDGIVLQLNNIIGLGGSHIYLRGFPCYLFSRYKEESEMLFMGGHYRIKIESVRIIEGKNGICQNFQLFFTALAKLNTMINGGIISPNEISKEKIIISSFFAYKLGKSNKNIEKFDKYILKTMDAFSTQITQIVLNYSYLCNDGRQDKEMRDLIMDENIQFNDDKKLVKAGEKINLFRKTLFKIFKNIKNIQIFTTGATGLFPCPL